MEAERREPGMAPLEQTSGLLSPLMLGMGHLRKACSPCLSLVPVEESESLPAVKSPTRDLHSCLEDLTPFHSPPHTGIYLPVCPRHQ